MLLFLALAEDVASILRFFVLAGQLSNFLHVQSFFVLQWFHTGCVLCISIHSLMSVVRKVQVQPDQSQLWPDSYFLPVDGIVEFS